MRKIAIYGGAFDPVHKTHLDVASAASTYLELDQLLWVPTGDAWHKATKLTPSHHRVAMLELALQDMPRMALAHHWQINLTEISRPGASYTVDTLALLMQENCDNQANAQWHVIMGADQFAALHTWKNWQEIVSRCTLVVVNRAGVELQADSQVLKQARWVQVPMIESTVSSSMTRDLVQKAAAGCMQARNQLVTLVPAAVLDYIEQHHLYS